MDYKKLSKEIISNIGGESNINSLSHCATRLRFKLKNRNNADKEKIESLDGVLSVIESGGQFQVVIGNSVRDVYEEIGKITQLTIGEIVPDETGNKENTDENLLSKAIDLISAIFTPLLSALAGAGILKGILMILTATNVLSEASGTYMILYAAADSVFYFLPMILAYTSAKKFNTNIAIAISIAGALIYPSIIELFNTGTNVSFLGIPVVLMSYTSSVIPIIIGVYILSILEKFLNKHIFEAGKNFLTPMICLVVIVPLTFIVIGPIGTYASLGLANGYEFVYALNPIIAGVIIGALWQVFVIFGIHWGFVPLMINSIATLGFSTLVAITGPSNFSQAGAALGVFLKAKDTKVKAISGSAALTGFFGITEPSIYGVTLKYKKPFIVASIAGAIGGGIVGGVGASAKGIVITGILTIPAFIGTGFIGFIVACLISFVISAVGTYLFGYTEVNENKVEEKVEINK